MCSPVSAPQGLEQALSPAGSRTRLGEEPLRGQGELGKHVEEKQGLPQRTYGVPVQSYKAGGEPLVLLRMLREVKSTLQSFTATLTQHDFSFLFFFPFFPLPLFWSHITGDALGLSM